MKTGDARKMEASLTALAETGVDLRLALFDRFFAAFPARFESFISVDAASRRMTDETLQMMLGLAKGQGWVWPLVAELVFTHRSYGALPIEEYDAFIDITVEELGIALGDAWSDDCAAAWRRGGDALKYMIRKARADWAEAMPAGAPQLAE